MRMIQLIVAMNVAFFIGTSWAVPYRPKLTPAQDCQTLKCVRNNIDSVDQKIVTLLGKRLTYVKRAGELKVHKKSIHDQKRENQILTMVSNQAQQEEYPGSIAKAVFKTILLQSNIYEKNP